MFKKTAPVVFVVLVMLFISAITVFSQSQMPANPSFSTDCRDFRRISGGESVISTFRWTSSAAADEYKLNIYGSDGHIVASRWYSAPTTFVDLNITDFATGGAFQWEVEALLNGVPLCDTGRSAMRLRPGSDAAPVMLVTDIANPGQFITIPLAVNTPIPMPSGLPPTFDPSVTPAPPTATWDPTLPTVTPLPTIVP